jgi:hypothetical protein
LLLVQIARSVTEPAQAGMRAEHPSIVQIQGLIESGGETDGRDRGPTPGRPSF